MIELQRRSASDRRQPHVSHQDLRHQLLDADRELYRLHCELERLTRALAMRPRPRARRVAAGAGTVIVGALAGGLIWQMCPSITRADERAVRVQTDVVSPLRVVEEAPRPVHRFVRPAQLKAQPIRAPRRHTVTSSRATVRVQPTTQPLIPRPLSPGEFGRRASSVS